LYIRKVTIVGRDPLKFHGIKSIYSEEHLFQEPVTTYLGFSLYPSDGLFVVHTVDEWLWGYNDTLLEKVWLN